MTLISAADLMESIGVLEDKIQWIQCPWCGDEVNKLRPCLYWNPNEITSHVCIECAESPKGFKYLEVHFPIPGVEIRSELMPMSRKLDSHYLSERSYRANISYGEFSFLVWPEGSSLIVLGSHQSPDLRKNYNNTFQVWVGLKNIFEKGTSVIDETKFKKGGWKK